MFPGETIVGGEENESGPVSRMPTRPLCSGNAVVERQADLHVTSGSPRIFHSFLGVCPC
jgi:hypothetical protein